MAKLIGICPSCRHDDFDIVNNNLFWDGVICKKCEEHFDENDIVVVERESV